MGPTPCKAPQPRACQGAQQYTPIPACPSKAMGRGLRKLQPQPQVTLSVQPAVFTVPPTPNTHWLRIRCLLSCLLRGGEQKCKPEPGCWLLGGGAFYREPTPGAAVSKEQLFSLPFSTPNKLQIIEMRLNSCISHFYLTEKVALAVQILKNQNAFKKREERLGGEGHTGGQ